jgi:hypothetical protein
MVEPVNAIDWLDIAAFGKCDELARPLIQVESAKAGRNEKSRYSL